MSFKVIAVLTFLCILQGSNSKGLNPFWRLNPYLTSPLDQELQPIIGEVQQRLIQAQAIAKSTIGLNVGLGSKTIGLLASQTKIAVKTLVNNIQSNPNNTKDCLSLNKDQISQLNSNSKAELSLCSKSSQLELKTLNQVQKDLSLQAATINNELNLAVSQCKLQNPDPTNTSAVVDCVSTKAEAIKEKVSELEQKILETIQSVDSYVSQVVNDAKTCLDQAQQQAQQQAEQIADELEQCSNTIVAQA